MCHLAAVSELESYLPLAVKAQHPQLLRLKWWIWNSSDHPASKTQTLIANEWQASEQMFNGRVQSSHSKHKTEVSGARSSQCL